MAHGSDLRHTVLSNPAKLPPNIGSFIFPYSIKFSHCCIVALLSEDAMNHVRTRSSPSETWSCMTQPSQTSVRLLVLPRPSARRFSAYQLSLLRFQALRLGAPKHIEVGTCTFNLWAAIMSTTPSHQKNSSHIYAFPQFLDPRNSNLP